MADRSAAWSCWKPVAQEMMVVTDGGYRLLTKFPSEKLISCPCVGSVLP